MAEPVAAALLQACGLPQAWGRQAAWCILETRFDQGLHFLSTWRAWKNDPLRPRMLHYVSLTSAPVGVDELMASAASFPELRVLAQELAPQWFGLLPGFHRLMLNDGQVLLTLCVGDLTAMLRAQRFLADTIYLDPDRPDRAGVSAWNVWAVKALARCCRRGSRLATTTSDASDLHVKLTQCGFEMQASQTGPQTEPANDTLSAQFNPCWTIKNTRDPSLGRPVAVGRCAVIGAGLAGASVAAALARRGWQVRVLDQADVPAAGASGLPVGLVVPHVSTDDCALSRLSRTGVRLMLYQARRLLRQGQDWDATGTLERRVDDAAGQPSIWHSQAAWLKPAQLVRAWLAQPGITFQGNASSALPLLETLQTTLPALGIGVNQLPVMHGVRGQLSWAIHPGAPNAAFPPFPVNGAGSVVPMVPVDGGVAWFVGSSYQPGSMPPSPDEKNHAANLGRLHKLLPILGQTIAKQFETGPINAWKNTRCVTADRLPVVGPLYRADQPSLWICAGMGSRGLSFSVLCAELLAARWGAEPLPVDAGLAKSLNALRGIGALSERVQP